MAFTYSKLAEVTVGSGGAATIDFKNIPQNYNDLIIMISMRHASSNDTAMGSIQVNGGISASIRLLGGTGSATFSATAPAYGINPANSTANTFNSTTMYISNYTSSTSKSISIDSANENNATAAVTALNAGLFTMTTTITSITVNAFAGNFAQYSSATLYGVKAEV